MSSCLATANPIPSVDAVTSATPNVLLSSFATALVAPPLVPRALPIVSPFNVSFPSVLFTQQTAYFGYRESQRNLNAIGCPHLHSPQRVSELPQVTGPLIALKNVRSLILELESFG